MRQLPDEEDEMPCFVVVGSTRSPGGHTGEADSILDDVVKLAVGEVLGFREAHIGYAGVKVLPHLGFSAAVIGVATRAMVGKVAARALDGFGSGIHRIFGRASGFGN